MEREDVFFDDALDLLVFDDEGAGGDFFGVGVSCAQRTTAALNAAQKMTTGRDFDFTAVTLILRENGAWRIEEIF